MNDERKAIGDWTEHEPEVRVVKAPDLADIDPRDYEDDEVFRDALIRKRRKAGLPDYPPTRESQE